MHGKVSIPLFLRMGKLGLVNHGLLLAMEQIKVRLTTYQYAFNSTHSSRSAFSNTHALK